MTRFGVLGSWIVGFAIASSFDQMLGLWVFLSSILISTVLVPILIGLYLPAWRRPRAGLLASSFGLVTVLAVNLVIVLLGDFAPADDTYVLTVEWASSTREIWQEHAMLFGIPASGIGFVTGLLMDRGGADT